MNESFAASEVISAFVDNEPFDAGELSAALADPSGRALLIDLIALRSLAQVESGPASLQLPSSRRRGWNWIAASLLLAASLAAGYGAGRLSTSPRNIGETPASDAAPPPTRVISDIEWRSSTGGN